MHNWTQIGKAIKAHPAGTPVPFTISRDGQQITKQVTLASVSWHKGAFLGVSPVVVYTGPTRSPGCRTPGTSSAASPPSP